MVGRGISRQSNGIAQLGEAKAERSTDEQCEGAARPCLAMVRRSTVRYRTEKGLNMNFDKCINCPDRYPACQDTCEYGIGQKKRYEADKAKIRQARAKERANRNYIIETMERFRRKH